MTTAPSQAPISDSSTQLSIDVWSDLACPWCYVGKHQLDQAIAGSPHADDISVRIHSYELDPDMSREATPNLELVCARYGLPPSQAAQMDGKVGAIARRAGLPFSADRVLANSFDVHRVLHLAGVRADRLLGILQRLLFSGQANVYDHAVLADAAARVGVDRKRVAQVLSGDEFADAVRADEEQARQLGVTGVPFTVFGERIAIPGSTTVDGFADAIEQAWSTT